MTPPRSAEANHTSPGVSRTELIRILADVSHQTWLRQMVRDQVPVRKTWIKALPAATSSRRKTS
jgi:hypothetical protein